MGFETCLTVYGLENQPKTIDNTVKIKILVQKHNQTEVRQIGPGVRQIAPGVRQIAPEIGKMWGYSGVFLAHYFEFCFMTVESNIYGFYKL